jgi:nanoRNase/pAp phosphatase (c-di-AMP/oligoRNAs hydrolase)
MTQERLDDLYDVARRAGRLLILTHNNPDPDAIASALALRHLLAQELGLESPIAYHGLVGRAENKALLRYLGQPLQPLASRPSAGPDLQDAPALALVNAQPGVGNITLPPGSAVVLAIDHHTPHPASEAVPFADVRPELGATSTILTSYLQAAGLEPSPPLATALFYGIKTNTMGLGRNTSPADADAFFYLRSRIDVEALTDIEHAQVPPDYFHSFDLALRVASLLHRPPQLPRPGRRDGRHPAAVGADPVGPVFGYL